MGVVDVPSRQTSLPWCWGVTDEEMALEWPCAGLVPQPYRTAWRGVDVSASPSTLFRWVCQVKVAPYSYDLIDNLGRRSPRELTPGVDDLAVGQKMIVFEIVSFERDVHITGRATAEARRLFGPFAGTYRVLHVGPCRSRLVVRLDLGGSGLVDALRRPLLGWGDLVMMRKQLLTLRDLAERSERREATCRH